MRSTQKKPAASDESPVARPVRSIHECLVYAVLYNRGEVLNSKKEGRRDNASTSAVPGKAAMTHLGVEPTDALSAVINDIHFRDARHIFSTLRGGWQLSMPEQDDEAGFCVVLEGRLRCQLESGKPYQAEAGDVLLFPGGDGHRLMSSTDDSATRAECASHVLGALRTGERQIILGSGAEEVSLMLCRFRIDRARARMLTSMLPAVVHVSGGNPPAWLVLGIQFVRIELASAAPGNDAILNRLVDVLFIQCVRYCMDTGQSGSRGWLAGLRDAGLARALAAMHERPGDLWTVATLAQAAGLSRSAFAARFRELVGESPLAYLGVLRMRQAEQLLRHTPLSLTAIAEELGYQSSQAFNRAFRRHAGVSPGRFRRTV